MNARSPDGRRRPAHRSSAPQPPLRARGTSPKRAAGSSGSRPAAKPGSRQAPGRGSSRSGSARSGAGSRSTRSGSPAGRRSAAARQAPAARRPPAARAPRNTTPTLVAGLPLPAWLGLEPPTRPRRPPFVPGRTRARGQRRYAVAYDLDGPRVRLGLLWFAAVFVALAFERLVVGLPLVEILFAATASLAAAQVARAWEQEGAAAAPGLAAVVAGAVSLSSLLGARFVGLTLLLGVGGVTALTWWRATRSTSVIEEVGSVLWAALVPAAAAVSVGLTLRYEIGAAVTLLLVVSAFDIGDFVIGSGAASAIEGPIAGGAAIAVVTGIVVVTNVPPFGGAPAWAFGALAAIACPLGQLLASALLPDSTSRAPALRRLDSLLVLAPLWAWFIGFPLAHAR